MFRSPLALLPLLPCALLALGAPARPTLPPASTRPVDYAKDVQPLFDRACVRCHGADKARSGLRLDAGALALKGGNSGAVVKPGDSAKSRLIHLVAGLEEDQVMPPGQAKKLTAAEIGVLRAWIDQGAKVPRGAGVVGGPARSSHWAFQPVRRAAPPAVRDGAWPRTAIDAFVLAKLEGQKITPSPEADRVTLIRRLSLDLLGLPPAPAEVEAFVSDRRPDAYERLVDRLLASPAYGERWGRHWLDLARYADSDGYEKDTGRPHAWRYRQWVIDALNGDLPYDRFTVEQIAGDLLPGATAEQKAATGFHRNTLTNKEGGVDQEQFRVEAVVDRVNTTAKVWLGLTLGCAQCHDHKYDPLSQREYYQFFAFFNSDVEVEVPAPVVGHSGPAVLPPGQQKKLAGLVQKEKAYRQKQLPVKQAMWERGLTEVQKKALPADVREALALPAARRTAKQQALLAEDYAGRDAELGKLRQQIAALRRQMSKVPLAQALALGRARKTSVMIRGDFLRPGVEVSAGVPAVLPEMRAKGATRLELARWLVAGDNPLTPRVAANWAWHKFFGRGLVPTLDDFGTQGERPSHPELLDWLASELVRQGWSLKALHRVIVTSATYRQSSATREELAARDPYNALLARQARLRLEAEGVRDVALAASGLLVPAVGGPSVRPPQPAGISELTYANSARWVESQGNDRYRRGLYTWFQRTSPYPMLLTFDAPDGNVSCSRRERSNTPLQALTLLNDTVFVECAQALARRVQVEGEGKVEGRLRYAFQLCTARAPTARELARLRVLYEELYELAAADEGEAKALIGGPAPAGASVAEAAAWVAVARVLLNLDEVVTRE